MSADIMDFDELKRHHHRHYHRQKAPPDAQGRAVARFSASQTRRNPWPVWGLVAAVLCAVLLIPAAVRNDDPEPDLESGIAGLSLNQVELPPRPSLSSITRLSAPELPASELSASELSTSTNLPLGVPNLSQLSVTRIEAKETI